MPTIGRPSKYQPSYCDLIVERMSQGDSMYDFCQQIDISTDTLYEWCGRYPTFSASYKKAQEAGKSYYLNLIRTHLTNKEVQPVLLQMLGRYAYNLSAEPKVRLPKLKTVKTPEEKMMILQEALADGEITPQQADKISNLLKLQSDLEVVGQLRADVEALKAQLQDK